MRPTKTIDTKQICTAPKATKALRLGAIILLLGMASHSIIQAKDRTQTNNAAPPAATAPEPPEHSFVLQANDFIVVKVYREPDLETQIKINALGEITLPLLGRLKVSGKSTEEAANAIQELYAKDYLVNPRVSVLIVTAAKRRFTVMGQVARPGSYEFHDEDELNLLSAIAMAGGFTRLASLNKVTVRREESGKIFNLTVDTKALASAKNQIQFKVLPGDIIDVGERVF